MGYGDKFRAKASEIIAKFSTENGLSSLFFRVSGDAAYDPISGQNLPQYDEYFALMAFDAIDQIELLTGNIKALDPKFTADHKICLIAGLDLPDGIEPRVGDLVTQGGSINQHKIASVSTDQYKALYTCYVAIKPE